MNTATATMRGACASTVTVFAASSRQTSRWFVSACNSSQRSCYSKVCKTELLHPTVTASSCISRHFPPFSYSSGLECVHSSSRRVHTIPSPVELSRNQFSLLLRRVMLTQRRSPSRTFLRLEDCVLSLTSGRYSSSNPFVSF
jgi:hypothetical protein